MRQLLKKNTPYKFWTRFLSKLPLDEPAVSGDILVPKDRRNQIWILVLLAWNETSALVSCGFP